MKSIMILLVVLFPLITNAQMSSDTVHMKHIYYVTPIYSKSNGRLVKLFINKRKVRLGYIIRLYNDVYLINGHKMKLYTGLSKNGTYVYRS